MKLYSSISLIFLIWLLSILFITFLGFLQLPHSPNYHGNFIESFANWDGRHFLTIAEKGYNNNEQYAFFPFYPLVISTLTKLTQNYLLSALIISVSSSFIAIQLLYKLILKDFDKKLAEKVIFSLLFFPTSFYFLTVYSEGLFFLLVVSSIYFFRTKKYFLASLTAAGASATRVSGLALILTLFIEIQINQGWNRKNWVILLAPFGFLLYCIFLFQQTSDPLYFVTAQKHWQRQMTIPFVTFWDSLRNLNNFNSFLDLLFSIFGLGFAIRSFRFLPSLYGVFAFSSVILPLMTASLSSMPRFLLPVFPVFILVSMIKNKYLNLIYQIIGLMLLAIYSIMFINGYWVA